MVRGKPVDSETGADVGYAVEGEVDAVVVVVDAVESAAGATDCLVGAYCDDSVDPYLDSW